MMVDDRRLALGSAAVYAAIAAGFGRPPRKVERAWFTRINDGGEASWLRVPQQLGTPWALPAAAIVLALAGRRADAAAALLALPAEKAAEVGTKKILGRPRPVLEIPTVLRDDAPVEGPAFPSGHTAIPAAATILLAPVLPRPVTGALLCGTGLAGFVRVHQGAHWPSDAVGGLFLGTAIATGLRATIAAIARSRRRGVAAATAFSAVSAASGR